MGQKIRLNYYETEEVTICPYCGDIKECDSYGCCGESSGHFETAIQHGDEVYQFDQVELYYPILDVIRFEILNKYVWLDRKRRLKQRLKRFCQQTYDNGKLLKLRQLTRFQWSRLDCLILEQIHDFPLYTKSPKQWADLRKIRVKEMRESWAKGELLGCDLVPPISETE